MGQKEKLAQLKSSGKTKEAESISEILKNTEKATASKKRELQRLDKQRKIKADTMCHTAEERTIINANAKLEHNYPSRAKKSNKSEAEEAEEFSSFLDKNTKIIDQYSEQKDIESS